MQDANRRNKQSTRNAEKLMEKLQAAIKRNEADAERCSLSRQVFAFRILRGCQEILHVDLTKVHRNLYVKIE